MQQKTFDSEVSDLIQSIGLFVRRARAAAASHELSLTEAAVLARLDNDGPATIADLARAEGMTPQSMGAAVAQLEQSGLIRRKPHPADGRQKNVDLTAKGLATRRSVRETRRMWLAQAVATLDKRDQETLFAAGVIIRRLAEL